MTEPITRAARIPRTFDDTALCPTRGLKQIKENLLSVTSA